MDERRWSDAWRRLGASAPPGAWDGLVARYREPRRAYHTTRHLQEAFDAFDQLRDLAEHPAEVELALWYHDAVYDTARQDSEERSAALAAAAMAAAGCAPQALARVRALILATKHSAEGAVPGGDTAVLLDADLAILAAPRERFDEYEREVRAEYRWVPGPAFRAGRRRVLAAFAARPTIYSTARGIALWEAPARENLARALR